MTKTCTKCGKELPATLEYFYKDGATKDGFMTQCKDCRYAVMKRYRQSAGGKIKIKRSAKKHRQSKKGKEYYKTYIHEYQQSEEGRTKSRGTSLKYKFNLTLEEYDQMFEAQNGVCAICKKPETAKYRGKIRRLAVDHDHETDKIRGLLCGGCNFLLGQYEKMIREELLNEFERYLEKRDG